MDNSTATNEEFVVSKLKTLINSSKLTIEKFGERLSEDPVYAFTIANEAMRSSVMLVECSNYLSALESGVDLAKVVEDLRNKLLYVSRYTPRSTSVISNEIDNYRREVIAELLESFEKWV